MNKSFNLLFLGIVLCVSSLELNAMHRVRALLPTSNISLSAIKALNSEFDAGYNCFKGYKAVSKAPTKVIKSAEAAKAQYMEKVADVTKELTEAKDQSYRTAKTSMQIAYATALANAFAGKATLASVTIPVFSTCAAAVYAAKAGYQNYKLELLQKNAEANIARLEQDIAEIKRQKEAKKAAKNQLAIQRVKNAQ